MHWKPLHPVANLTISPFNSALWYLLILLTVMLFSSCSAASPTSHTQVPITQTSSRTSIPPTSQPSTSIITPTPTIQVVKSTSTNTAIPTPHLNLVPNELRLAYLIQRNLFVQIGSNTPKQLTGSGEDKQPHFMPSGEEILFLRGSLPHHIYKIDTDGNNEKAITTESVFQSLGYDAYTEPGELTVVPGENQLLFNTHQLDPNKIVQKDTNNVISKYNQDLLLANIDTLEIKRISAPGTAGSFYVSPDGKTVAVHTEGHIDLIDINGKVIRKNLVRYTPTKPDKLTPFIFWASDSTSVIVALPAGVQYDMSTPGTYSIWRYPVDGSVPQEIPLDPAPMGDFMSTSLDSNYILYNHFSEEVTGALYIGDLRNGQARLYETFGTIYQSHVWSVNSTYFIYGGLGNKIVLGHIKDQPTPINNGKKASFLGWIDEQRYLYFADGKVLLEEVGKPAVIVIENTPKGFVPANPDRFTYIFLNLQNGSLP